MVGLLRSLVSVRVWTLQLERIVALLLPKCRWLSWIWLARRSWGLDAAAAIMKPATAAKLTGRSGSVGVGSSLSSSSVYQSPFSHRALFGGQSAASSSAASSYLGPLLGGAATDGRLNGCGAGKARKRRRRMRKQTHRFMIFFWGGGGGGGK